MPGLRLAECPGRLEWMEEPWEEVRRAGARLLELAAEFRPDLVQLGQYAFASLPWRVPVLVVGHSCVCSWLRAVRGEEAAGPWLRYRREVAAGLRAADLVTAPTRTHAGRPPPALRPLPRRRGGAQRAVGRRVPPGPEGAFRAHRRPAVGRGEEPAAARERRAGPGLAGAGRRAGRPAGRRRARRGRRRPAGKGCACWASCLRASWPAGSGGPRSSPCRRATSRSGCPPWRPDWPGAPWCWGTSPRCVRPGRGPPASCRRTTQRGWPPACSG